MSIFLLQTQITIYGPPVSISSIILKNYLLVSAQAVNDWNNFVSRIEITMFENFCVHDKVMEHYRNVDMLQ